MRTTVTLDDDVVARIKRVAHERGLSFKDAINALLRAGLGAGAKPKPYRVPSRPLGLRPGFDLDKASQLAAALEDDELIRKLEMRK